jgi:UDP-GlcNAc:undecaprenyl-phosphate GlcNAc-1-phosphate transferase
MNALNLLDGLDGLAAGATLFVTLTLFIVSTLYQVTLGMLIMAAVSGAILGFLVFNFPPAKIFLGDCGSMLLGFLVAALSLVGASRRAEAAVALFVPVIALGLPILDTGLAIVRRWYKRLPLGAPDRQHIHHVLVAMGYSHRRVVLTLYLICVLLGVAALAITFARSEVVIIILGALLAVVFVSVRIFAGVGFREVFNRLSVDSARRERAMKAAVSLNRAVQMIRHARNEDALWAACEGAFGSLNLRHARMDLHGRGSGGGKGVTEAGLHLPQNGQSEAPVVPRHYEWRAARDPGSPSAESNHGDEWVLRLELREGDLAMGTLSLRSGASEGMLSSGVLGLVHNLRKELAIRVAQLEGAGAGKVSPDYS